MSQLTARAEELSTRQTLEKESPFIEEISSETKDAEVIQQVAPRDLYSQTGVFGGAEVDVFGLGDGFGLI